MLKLVYRATFHKLSAAFIISALLCGVWGENRFFSYGLALMAALNLLAGWICLMEANGIQLGLLEWFRSKKPPVPYALRNHASRRMPHRPLFALDFNDFDDDLTSRTAITAKTPEEASRQRMFSSFICAGLLFAISFL